MTGTRLLHWLSARLRRGALLAGCLILGFGGAFALQPGEPAPLFEELLREADVPLVDGRTEGPLVIVFSKGDDAHSERFLLQLREMQGRSPELFQESNGVVVLSRLEVSETFDEQVIPADWAFIRDEGDRYYAAYTIIATPTALVVGSDGRIIGFHPGYSPGLVRSVQLDLSRDLRGMDDMRTPAPEVPMQLQLARRLAGRGLWDRAIGYYRNAAEEGTLSPPLRVEMADALYETGEKEEALAALHEAGAIARTGERAPDLERIAAAADVKMTDGIPESPMILLFVPPRDAAPAAREHLAALTGAVERAAGGDAALLLCLSASMTDPRAEGSEWGLLTDSEAVVFLHYAVFMAPTVAVISDAGDLQAVYPGFSDDYPGGVAEVLRPGPGSAGADYPLELLLGRALAAAGRMERALHYYQAAAEETTLDPRALREFEFLKNPAGTISPLKEDGQHADPPSLD